MHQSFDTAETRYVDMQMSRLADVEDRVGQAEARLAELDNAIRDTAEQLGIWVVSSNVHVDDLYNIYFSKDRALKAVQVLLDRQRPDSDDDDPWDGDPVCLGQVLEGQAFGSELLVAREEQDVFLDVDGREIASGVMESAGKPDHMKGCPRSKSCPRLLPQVAATGVKID